VNLSLEGGCESQNREDGVGAGALARAAAVRSPKRLQYRLSAPGGLRVWLASWLECSVAGWCVLLLLRAYFFLFLGFAARTGENYGLPKPGLLCGCLHGEEDVER
jgi:hypothetical protein